MAYTFVRPCRVWRAIALALIAGCVSLNAELPLHAQTTAIFLRLLDKTPPERQANLLKLICQRATPDELRTIYERLIAADGFTPAVQLAAVQELTAAAVDRKVQPSGDLDGIKLLLQSTAVVKDPEFVKAIVRLGGLWKIDLGDELLAMIRAPRTSASLRRTALEAIVALGGPAADTAIAELADPKQPPEIRLLAIDALARRNVDRAIEQTIPLLTQTDATIDPATAIQAVLNQQAGADKLATALADAKLSPDAAKLALRAMYAVGRTDATLVKVLSDAAGLNADPPPLTPEDKQRLVEEVLVNGDPQRGELIFRRSDLSCLKCHAVSGAGGNVGPDLSNLGAGSPIDYIVESILLPDQAIKEEFISLLVLDVDGRVHQGIKVQRDERRLVLRDAQGIEIVIPVAEIEDEKQGKSLMPKGLTAFMTHAEFVDLVRFISELGKPGPYAVRTTPALQRWRVLTNVPQSLVDDVPDDTAFRAAIIEADELAWENAYGKVSGVLPLDEWIKPDRSVLYLRSEIDATVAGAIDLQLDAIDGVTLWLDDQPLVPQPKMQFDLSPGRHWLTFRVDTARRPSRELYATLSPVEGSPAIVAPVKGR